jgi:oligosaccharide repeat unit polymerase
MILTLKNIFESKNKKVVAFIIIALATAVFLYSRYIMLGIDSDLVTEFIFVFFIVCLLLLGTTYYFKNPLNPINFYTLFILCYGFNFLKLSTVSKALSYTTHLVIILSIVFFVFGVLFGNKIKTEQKVLMNRQSKATIFYVTFVCIILTFLLEIKTFGYLPLLKMFSMDVYKDTNDKLLSFLHYFIIIAAIIPSWAYILNRKEIISKKAFIWFSIGALFILINYLSRQIFFLFLISTFTTYSFYNSVSVKKIVIALFTVVFIFILMGNIRIMRGNSTVGGYTAEQLLRDLGQIKYKTNIFESYLNIYSSQRFDSMDKFVQMKKEEDFFGMGIFTLRPLSSVLFLDRMGIVDYKQYNVTTNIAGYAIDPYLDFGLLGVILLNFLYGFICRLTFINFNQGNTLYIIPWALLIFCLIMAPFMNYFNTFIIWFAIFFNRLILK